MARGRSTAVTHLAGCSLAAVLLVTVAAEALAQEPAGPEFRVNAYTTARQAEPVVATDGAGNFVVAWETYGLDGTDYGVSARRYTASGKPRGEAFPIESFLTGDKREPAVASDADGNFVIAWTGYSQGGAQFDVFARRYDPAGIPLGPEFRVNTYLGRWQTNASVVAHPGGAFVIVWDGVDASGGGVFAQRYDEDGVPRGSELQVNTYTSHHQNIADVAMDVLGNFVVVWRSTDQDGDGLGVFGQRFDAGGARLGTEFRVNTITTGDQWFPSVAMNTGGDFTVVWQGPLDGSSDGIFGQRYDPSGAARGAEFRVNSYTTSAQWFPSIAMAAGGSFVVTWGSHGQDGNNWGIFGQRYDTAGSPHGGEFRVNSTTLGLQSGPAIAMDPADNFVVVWTGEDGSDVGVFGQRYSDLLFADGFED
jgi:hypothetical protein